MPLAAKYREKETGGEWHSRSLHELMVSESEALDMSSRWHLVREIAGVLAWLHRESVVHGALKPSNIFLSGKERRRAILADLGQSPGYENMIEVERAFEEISRKNLVAAEKRKTLNFAVLALACFLAAVFVAFFRG